MRKALDLTGQRFGRLVAIRRIGTYRSGHAKWLCRCDCGNFTEVASFHLKQGKISSCGCYGKKVRADSTTTHGGARDRLYGVWCGMKCRCENPNETSYKNYGGRGIKVCDEWHDYAKFREWAYANGYNSNAKHGDCTLDRVDYNGNYEPSNCRWVGSKVQQNNKRNNVMLVYKGETHTVAQWSQITGISEETIRARLKLGMPIEKILYGGDLRNERARHTERN